MKLNTAWLLKYLDKPIPHRELVDAMPRAGLEVEVESDLRKELAPVRIGFVRSIEPIADASGMFATKVEIERGKLISVLVGSEHEVKAGWGVPVAPAGVTLPTGKKVSAGKFHGVDSVGMICLDGEMGLIARDYGFGEGGLYHTTDESQLGKSIVEVLPIEEYLIELKVLPNRPDCLGVLGISREMAALFGVGTKWPTIAMPKAGSEKPIEVEIREPELCPRFTGAMFRNVKVQSSPGWLKSVLLTAGMRPINNVVDITNFVMWEAGQPMHAFDLKKLAGPKVVVRKLGENESIELLTGKVLNKKYGQPLCICDAEKPQGMAGIMGGKSAETTEASTDVLLEVACFDPVHIRSNVKTLRKLDGAGGTDASYRFERGVDPNAMLDWARTRAYSLIHELTGGVLVAPPTDRYVKRIEPKMFRLTPDRVSHMVGMPVDFETIHGALTKLGYGVADSLTITVPTFRVDVNDPVVLMEDVARMIGYDNIPMGAAVGSPTRGQACLADQLRTNIAKQLVSMGWYETKNDPLESGSAAKWLGQPADAITLANAATAEMAVLRRSLLTGLFASTQRNIFRGAQSIRLFEIDRTFSDLPGTWTLAGVTGGVSTHAIWRGETKIDFFTVKGELEDLFAQLRVNDVVFKHANHPPLKPGETASIEVKGQVVGHIGLVDSSIVKIDRLPFKLYAFEIDLAKLEPFVWPAIAYTPVNKLPAVTRDLAIVVRTSDAYADIVGTIRRAASELLEQVQLVDEYKGAPVPKDHRSLALRLTFRAAGRTLTTDEVSGVVDGVVKTLAERFGATLRA